MKIASVKALALKAPLDLEAQKTALGSRAEAALVLVEVTTDDGIVGYGEALARYSLRAAGWLPPAPRASRFSIPGVAG